MLRTYTGEPNKFLGMFTAQVKYRGQECSLPLLLVDGDGPSLFGHNWLTSVSLDWKASST